MKKLFLSFFICCLIAPSTYARVAVKHGQCLKAVVMRANEAIQKASTEMRLDYSGVNDRCLNSIVEAIRENKHLVRIYLAHNGLTDASAETLSVLFNMNNSLQGVDLSSNYLSSLGLNLVIDSLISNQSLTFLYLRDMQLDLSSVAAIAKLLAKSHSLRNIDLSLNALGSYGIATLKTNLAKKGEQVETLGLFSAKLAGQGKVIADLISSMPNLKWLDLGANDLTHSDLDLIMEALEVHGSIEGLDLSFNGFDDIDVELIASRVKHFPKLVRLGLGHNKITDKGLKLLADSLDGHDNIHQLGLESNELTDVSIDTFHQLLSKCPSLTNIISVNNGLTKKYVMNFSLSQKYDDKFVVVAKNHRDMTVYDDQHKPIV